MKPHSIERRCAIGPENVLFAGASVHLSAQKLYRLGSEGVNCDLIQALIRPSPHLLDFLPDPVSILLFFCVQNDVAMTREEVVTSRRESNEAGC